MDLELFRKRLRQARKNARMSGQQVADVLWTTQAVIARYESGERVPNIVRVAELAQVYGVSIDWLCGRNE